MSNLVGTSSWGTATISSDVPTRITSASPTLTASVILMAVYEGAVAGAQVLDMHVGSGGREHEVAPGDLGFVQRDVAAGAPEAQLPIEFELLSDPGPHAEDDGDQRW